MAGNKEQAVKSGKRENNLPPLKSTVQLVEDLPARRLRRGEQGIVALHTGAEHLLVEFFDGLGRKTNTAMVRSEQVRVVEE